MTRIDRYILAQLLRVFGFFSLVLIGVYWVNRASSIFDQMIADGQSVRVFLEFTALSLPMMIRAVLPVAAFVATLFVTHRLLSQNEISVLHAAGVTPLRLARPYLAFGLIVAAFLTFLVHVLIPEARAQLAQRQAEIGENIAATLLRAGVFQHPTEGVTIFIAEISPEGTLRGLYLSDARSPDQRIDYTARSALIVPERTGPKLVMIDGQAQILDPATGRMSVTGFADFTYDLGGLIGAAGGRRTVQELPTLALFNPGPALQAETGATLAEFRYELVSRMVYGLGTVAAVLIGYAALIAGAFNRLGFVRPILTAIVLLALTELAVTVTARVAMRQADLAWMAVLPVILSTAMALMLIALASRRRRVRMDTGDRGKGAARGTGDHVRQGAGT